MLQVINFTPQPVIKIGKNPGILVAQVGNGFMGRHVAVDKLPIPPFFFKKMGVVDGGPVRGIVHGQQGFPAPRAHVALEEAGGHVEQQHHQD